MKKKLFRTIAWFLILWFPVAVTTPVYAQFDDMSEEDLFSGETTEESGTTEAETPTEEVTTPDPEIPSETLFDEDTVGNTEEESSESLFGPEITEDAVITTDETIDQTTPEITPPATGSEGGTLELSEPGMVTDRRKSLVQNAVLEGIQLSKEPGDTPDENIITCYFIFRDKPTSYFYEAKVKQKTIVFEFNDVVLGPSPIPQAKEPPIQGFRTETEKVDANREVVGLNPEWHDILKVSFFFDAVPEITVKDEYSVISFSFRWSTDPEKQKELVQDEGGNKALLFSLIGGGVGISALAGILIFFKDEPAEEHEQELTTIHDEIIHPDPTIQ